MQQVAPPGSLPLGRDLPDPEAVPVMLAYDALREELAALAASGRPVPTQVTKTTLSDFTGGCTNDP